MESFSGNLSRGTKKDSSSDPSTLSGMIERVAVTISESMSFARNICPVIESSIMGG